jgi:predicted DNA binding CopG/RHH family protein
MTTKQERYAKKQADQGKKRVTFWVPEDKIEAVKEYVAKTQQPTK